MSHICKVSHRQVIKESKKYHMIRLNVSRIKVKVNVQINVKLKIQSVKGKGRTDSEGLGFSSCAAPLTRVCALNFRLVSEESSKTSEGAGNFGRTFRTGASNFRMSAGKFWRNFRKLQ
ncbi:hypothetical protein C8R48DRAFT_672170 [Suillus tomentosus]|nr:hypothetical protein C8R48DRAFT_672170 [Suillus tomentosus]